MTPPQAAGPRPCGHCGLPVRASSSVGEDELLFCCVGCRLARAVSGTSGERGLLEARLLFSAFLAMGIMTFSLVLYAEDLIAVGDEPGLELVRSGGRALLALLSLPVIVLLGAPLMAGAAADLRAGRVRMDGLIVLATTAAYGLSLHHTWTGEGPVYFETAAMVLVLVTFGRRLEAHARTRGRDAATALAELLPEHAHRVRAVGGAEAGEVVEAVEPTALRPGDVCSVLPGEAVPADGRILVGRGEVFAAHLTGEQRARSVAPGDEVPAGAVNGHAALRVAVTAPSEAGTLGRLRALLEAPLTLTASMRQADQLAGALVVVALLLSLVGALAAPDASRAVQVVLSVLLVACPCALGLATPLAYRAVRAALARQGILIHDAAALERAAAVDRVLLDKTGTLTEPVGGLVERAVRDGAAFARLGSLVKLSGHALAVTVRHVADEVPEDVRAVPGGGVVGRVDGHVLAAGRPEWLDGRGVRWPESMRAAARRSVEAGETVVALAEEDEVTAVGSVRHLVRAGAAEAVAHLRGAGVGIAVLSGDHQAAVDAVTVPLDLEGEGGLQPEDKLARLEVARRAGHVVLVAGDGVNDAPSLRAADVGVAMASGAAAARQGADVELVGDDLRAIEGLLAGARQLRRTVRANLAWTVAYNVVALGAATAGLLHPLLAVTVMIASSLVVSLRSHRLLSWRSPSAAGSPVPREVVMSAEVAA